MKSSAKKIELASVDDLFSTEEGRQDAKLEKIQEIPLSELHPFKNHPFKVKDDEAMMETADSIKQYGVLVPAIARPDPEGGYELVAGHRRHRASELADKETMPVIVRDLDDDAATIIMVDSNLQRESLLLFIFFQESKDTQFPQFLFAYIRLKFKIIILKFFDKRKCCSFYLEGGTGMKILKCLLMIITAPVILLLTLFAWLCTGLLYISGLVLGLFSMVIVLLGVAVLITYSPQNGVILLVMAFLISPMGLPLAAIWLLSKVQSLKFAIQDRVYG